MKIMYLLYTMATLVVNIFVYFHENLSKQAKITEGEPKVASEIKTFSAVKHKITKNKKQKTKNLFLQSSQPQIINEM